MLRKLLALIAIFGVTTCAMAQSGTLSGTITEEGTGEPAPFANIVIESGGTVVAGGVTDFDGLYSIKPIAPGQYTVKISFIGFATRQINDVVISPDKITVQNAALKKASDVLAEVEIIEYVVPLIDPDKTGTTKTKDEIVALPTRNIGTIAATTAGVSQVDEGDAINVRGSRSESTVYFVDGVKVRGSAGVPQAAMDQLTVITGGVPAQYGDVSGGVISITTRGPSPMTFGSLELATSEVLDDYGFNLVGFSFSTPLLRKKDEDRTPILGVFFSGEYQSQRDPDPSAVGAWRIKSDKLAELQADPINFTGTPGAVASTRAAEFLNFNDFENVGARENVANQNIRLQTKFSMITGDNSDLTFGGNYNRTTDNAYIRTYALFNADNNPEQISQDWRVYARFQQRFNNAEDENAAIKNAFYSLQADYTKTNYTLQSSQHTDNFFNYGYLGKFVAVRENTITEFGTETVTFVGADGNTYTEDIVVDNTGATPSNFVRRENTISHYDFTASDHNPLAAIYTSEYFDYIGDNPIGSSSLQQISAAGGLINGQNPLTAYSLWSNPGTIFNSYQTTDNTQFRVVGSASADIKGHEIKFGFEYEQRSDRAYSLSPQGLWSIGRQLVNEHLTNPTYQLYLGDNSSIDGSYQIDAFYEELGRDESNISQFGINVREALGLKDNDWVDFDANYPTDYNVGMFRPDDLISNNMISYFGYDYEGNLLSGTRPTFDDFLNDLDDDGEHKREIGAFEPIYVAGYIQDKFYFKDLLFNVGVRVDRFDANQEVLNDRYVLYETFTAGETADQSAFADVDHPTNIGSGYVVYTDNVENPSRITGYRNGDNWYDASGVLITDPSVLQGDQGISPYLKNPENLTSSELSANGGLTSDAFQDYTPQVTVMPRIAFNFPISDEAQFYAHYDVLTQRPTGFVRMDPTDYLNWALGQNSQNRINNPDLRPQKTTEYELGFKQTLGRSSALSVSAFYRELRDMIQVQRINFAYPRDYTTFSNIDFGTVKGFSLTYEMRRTNNISFNASYTMSFADGSGSSATDGLSLVNLGEPNLRTTLPLDFDQRHSITTSIDYSFGSGARYDGPIWFGKRFFENARANLLISAASGTPYSRYSNVTTQVTEGLNDSQQLLGSKNGSRLPWIVRLDTRFSKSFDFKWGKEKDKDVNMNVYFQINNILDTRNIVNVYGYTGNPDDDGYISSTNGSEVANDQEDPQAYRDQYSVKVDNPANYSRPRTFRLGLMLNF